MVTEELIMSAAHRLAAAAASPARVVLFGSSARGAGSAASDLDFLVIEERVESRLRESLRLRDALTDIDVPVDILVLTNEEAEAKRLRPGSVVKRAMSEGRVLIEP